MSDEKTTVDESTTEPGTGEPAGDAVSGPASDAASDTASGPASGPASDPTSDAGSAEAADTVTTDSADSDGSDGSDANDPQGTDGTQGGGSRTSSRMDLLEQEGDVAADYLEELLDIADFDGDLDMDVEGDRAAVSIVGADLNELVGRNGEVLEALQELSRLAVYRETGERSRLMLDIGGYRAKKRVALEGLAAEKVDQVKETGEAVALDAMSPFERKVVHDAVAAAGLKSESEGAEPRRHVVILPA